MNNSKQIPKLTYEQCVEWAKSLQPGDLFFVTEANLIDAAIRLGTGNDDGFDPIHVGTYVGDGMGKTIEADGKAVDYHLISDYYPKLMAGGCRIRVFRIKNLTVEELELIKSVWKRQYKKPYSMAALGFFGIWGSINKILPPLGWLVGRIRNPGIKRDRDGKLESYVCSIASCEQWESVARVKRYTGDKALENRTPENLYNTLLNRCLECAVVSDTLQIAVAEKVA